MYVIANITSYYEAILEVLKDFPEYKVYLKEDSARIFIEGPNKEIVKYCQKVIDIEFFKKTKLGKILYGNNDNN